MLRTRWGSIGASWALIVCAAMLLAACGGEQSSGASEATIAPAQIEAELEREEERFEAAKRAKERQQARRRQREKAQKKAREARQREAARESREQREAEEAQQAEAEEAATAAECDPNYEGACLDPYAADYDCEGGSGDGPEYTGAVIVVGTDHYGLDSDNDGYGCE